MLERLFTSKTRVGILAQFLSNPGSEYHIRGMARAVHATPILVQRELKNLEQLGLLKKRRVGKMVLYRMDEDASIADDLKRIFLKTEGLGAQLLAGISRKEREKIRFALIYGSFAKGVEVASSDVDLLVIGDVDEDTVLESVVRAEGKTGRQVSLVLWTENEFLEKAGPGTPLTRELAETPVIMIVGDSNEFRRLVKRGHHRGIQAL